MDPPFVSLSAHHGAWHLEGEPPGFPGNFLNELETYCPTQPKAQAQMRLRAEAATR